MSSILKVDTIQNTSGASEVKIDAIKDTGGNTIISSNGTGTFTSNLPSTSANDNYFLAFRSGGNASPFPPDNTPKPKPNIPGLTL